MSILRFLGFGEGGGTTAGEEVESIRQISRKLEELPPEKARYIAAFAYLLGRVAHADLEISKEEARAMERIIAEKAHLPEEQTVMVVEIAKHQNRLFGHVENFLVTREFNELSNRGQRMDLLDCLYAVCASDRMISMIEDNEIRQISSELLLDREDFIRIRSRYRDYLSILQNPSE
ncbi:MAG: TerB family tellurite resistance protein [Acidobacteriota bacterium]|nr:MAG: TerB family tellurite resistance protein [Acidobacteriota bacterium]